VSRVVRVALCSEWSLCVSVVNVVCCVVVIVVVYVFVSVYIRLLFGC